ncbi:hypothetical protein Hanom_Chr12g01107971 [Helianthus anomalus]
MLLLLVFEQIRLAFTCIRLCYWFEHVVHKFQLDSLALSFTFRYILSSASCIHLHSVQIAHNFAAIRLLHSLVAFRYCKSRLLHSLAFRFVQIVSSDCSCCCYSSFT